MSTQYGFFINSARCTGCKTCELACKDYKDLTPDVSFRRVYEYAIDQFINWYCSEPRLAFNRIVVVRYRMYLESRHLAANTINQQLAAVRRLAHEAADAGLLSPELAAGISRVKGVKQLGFRSGNWLSAEQSSEVLQHACGDTIRAKRDYAMLAMLFGCGFR